jgi:hypothetical protein
MDSKGGSESSNGQYLRTIPADAVEYHIYVDPTSSTSSTSPTPISSLETIASECRAHVLPLTSDYLWQREAFQLKVWPSDNSSEPPHIWGRTAFGDNIEGIAHTFLVCCQEL